MRLLLFFTFCISLYPITVKELFYDKDMVKKIYIDEWLSDIKLKLHNPQRNKLTVMSKMQLNLIELSQSLPIRIIYDKGLISLMQPGFRRSSEPLNFRANLIALTTQDLIHKLNSMNGWFLRSKIRFKIYGDKDQYTLINFITPKEFYLNQFDSDFKEFSNALFGEPRYSLKMPLNDWLSIQRDLIFENHTGLIPDPYGGFNLNFSKIFRSGPGSNLPPLSRSEGLPHPSHIH